MSFSLSVAKDRIKFSAAHFTIFTDKEAERLHGHNYYISITVKSKQVDALGFCMPLSDLKDESYKISQTLDEKILIAETNPYSEVKTADGQVDVKWSHKRYSFPEEDVLILPISNVTCENLAFWFWQELAQKIPKKMITHLKVTVSETQGQEASYAKGLTE